MADQSLREGVAREIVNLRKPGGRTTVEEDRAVERILALLDRPSVGEGYRVVQVEPTEAMIIAGVLANQDRIVGDVYRAMLASAPPPPVGGERGGWRSMDSAPKDGTSILAYCVHPNARLAGEDVAEWTEIVVTRWIDFNGGGWTWNGICGEHVAWQPLPPPPEGEAP